jgi:phosphoglycerate dehydrogenase-like enzyme
MVAPLAPNLVLTPHAAYYSEAAEERAVLLAVARVREILGA